MLDSKYCYFRVFIGAWTGGQQQRANFHSEKTKSRIFRTKIALIPGLIAVIPFGYFWIKMLCILILCSSTNGSLTLKRKVAEAAFFSYGTNGAGMIDGNFGKIANNMKLKVII